LDHYEAFFKTDHHWKPEAGFWAANKIRDYFVNKGILDNDSPDVSDLSNFNVDVYPDIFMGSYSKKVGANFGGLDDISLIYPKFYTNFRVTGKGINKSGSFKDVFFDMQHMATGFQKHPYTVYPNPLEQYFHFYNGRGINKKTIFWGGDSYGTVCAPFLSLSVENVIFGFYAYAGLIELIDNSNPDIVIILLNGRLPREHLVKLSEQFNDASY
jgi:hypothetical protein